MRCQNCGEPISSTALGPPVHRRTWRRECALAPIATPPPDDTPTVTPVDGR